MLSGVDITFLILSLAGFVLGMLGNVFIGLVNCCEWIKNQNISLADFIFTCLAISRIGQLLVLLLDSLVIGRHLHPTYKLTKSISFLWNISNHLTFWLAACLGMFYLLKIARFSHPSFLWLRWRMNRVVLGILVLSLFFLIFDLTLLEMSNDLFSSDCLYGECNATLFTEARKTLHAETMSLLNVSSLFPTVLSLTSLLLLCLSLVKHIRNLQLNSMGSGDSSTEAHKSAIKMVISFLFFFAVHYFSTQAVSWIFFMYGNQNFVKFVSLATYVFPSGHAFLLILGSCKLRQTAWKVLWHLKSSWKR